MDWEDDILPIGYHTKKNVRRDRKTDDQRRSRKVEKLDTKKEIGREESNKRRRKESNRRRTAMAITKMSEEATAVAFVKEPTQGLGKGVGRVDLAREVTEDKVTSLTPFLNGKPLDVDMASPFGRFAMVDNLDTRLVVLEEDSRLRSGKIEFAEN